jgi:hypothetical protein
MFTWRMEGGTSEAISGRRPETFLLAGLQARIDLGGVRDAPPRVANARPP